MGSNLKTYISPYRRALQEVGRFAKMDFDNQCANFVPMAQHMIDCDCKGLIIDMVKGVDTTTLKYDEVKELYTNAVSMCPDSIRAMSRGLINEEIADIATKARGSLLDHVPLPIRTATMYARKANCEDMVEDTMNSIEYNMRRLDFVKMLKNIGAEKLFATESEFIADCHEDFVLKYIDSTLRRCAPLVITDPLWYRMTRDFSAPHMFEIKTSPISSPKELATLFCITLCLGKLEDLEYIRIMDGCGTHVHIDATNESYRAVKSVEQAYLDNITVINRLMKASRLFNNYCLPTACNMRLKEEQLRALGHDKLRKMKFHAVNTLAWFYNGTTEFRQYEGTTDVASLFSWIEFIHRFDKNFDNVGHCATAGTLFDRIGLSKRARQFFTNKFMESHRRF